MIKPKAGTGLVWGFLFSVFFSLDTRAQHDIPLGTWRAHISFNAIHSVAPGDQKIYAAAKHGIMVLDRSENSITILSKLDGLAGKEITHISFDQSSGQLLIAYEDGKFDVMKDNTIRNFDPSANSAISGSKKINGIQVGNGAAYLSTDYGVVVFDLSRSEVRETWRDLGTGGQTLKILASTLLGDSVFLATEKGILIGNRNDNLLDFNKWKRIAQGDFNGAVQFITSFNNKIYAAINGSGVYHYQDGAWTKETFLSGLSFRSVTASTGHLLITEGNNVWRLDQVGQLTSVADPTIVLPLTANEEPNGKLWIGDGRNGLVSDIMGSFARYQPNGPSSAETHRLKYASGKMYLLPGGYSPAFQPLGNPGVLNIYENGVWQQSSRELLDLTDLDFLPTGNAYLASFGYGVEERTGESQVKIYNEENSTLINLNPPGDFVNIAAVESSEDGLWVANYGTTLSLHLLKNDHQWQSYSFPVVAARYPLELAVDFSGFPWMVLNPEQGGGIIVFDPSKNQYEYITNQTGAGELPSKSVRSIVTDRDGYVWVGTDAGVAYFASPTSPAIKPIFDNRFLLKDDKVTAIAVDGGNRKWMGTERGVWLFSPSGEELIHNFTEENSALLSNNIKDIEINASTGEVFFATDRGVVSFRSDASESVSQFGQVKIFPNPVLSNFTGTVGITGLATDATVKITDVSGKLVWQTRANGGTASWNVEDYNGRRAATGIYLVFAATQDGAESVVGKIAVVE
jgi:ligand-binding sensor domain-containing protein